MTAINKRRRHRTQRGLRLCTLRPTPYNRTVPFCLPLAGYSTGAALSRLGARHAAARREDNCCTHLKAVGRQIE